MTWNLRLTKKTFNKGELNEEDWLSLREVFYNEDGSIFAYTENPVSICGSTKEEVKEYLEMCLRALDKDIIIEEDVKFSERIDPIETIPLEDLQKIAEEEADSLISENIVEEKNLRILSNKAQCLRCEEIIESQHRHDFVTCKCGNLSVDGGKDYLKRSFTSEYLEMSESEVIE